MLDSSRSVRHLSGYCYSFFYYENFAGNHGKLDGKNQNNNKTSCQSTKTERKPRACKMLLLLLCSAHESNQSYTQYRTSLLQYSNSILIRLIRSKIHSFSTGKGEIVLFSSTLHALSEGEEYKEPYWEESSKFAHSWIHTETCMKKAFTSECCRPLSFECPVIIDFLPSISSIMQMQQTLFLSVSLSFSQTFAFIPGDNQRAPRWRQRKKQQFVWKHHQNNIQTLHSPCTGIVHNVR